MRKFKIGTSFEGFSTYSPTISIPSFVHGVSATASWPTSSPLKSDIDNCSSYSTRYAKLCKNTGTHPKRVSLSGGS